MEKMKFNPLAFVAPPTKEEYSALLDEAIATVEELHRLVDQWKQRAPNAHESAPALY